MASKYNILHIMTSSFGGASTSAIRLHKALLAYDIDSKILALDKDSLVPKSNLYADISRMGWLKNPIIKYRAKKDYFKKLHLLENKRFTPELFSLSDSFAKVENHPLVKKADVIHLHWVANFINYKSFFKNIDKPIVWTLHDENPYTGGCHFSFDCDNFIKNNCQNCPQLEGIQYTNLSQETLNIKKEAIRNKKIDIVCPSNWILKESEKSMVFRNKKHHRIAYNIEEEIFKSYDKSKVREELNLPQDKKLILFVADSIDNYRKGVKYIIEASKQFGKEYRFVLVGRGTYKKSNFINMGFVNDEVLMAKIYSAVDLFVIPSLADNLPNTVLESLFCGTPVVGFNIGGIPDMIIDGENGFLCNEINSLELARIITKSLDFSFDNEKIIKDVRIKYNTNKQTKSYIELYHNVLGR